MSIHIFKDISRSFTTSPRLPITTAKHADSHIWEVLSLTILWRHIGQWGADGFFPRVVFLGQVILEMGLYVHFKLPISLINLY